MAYSKKTWKARQGLGLNKFSIDGATPVPVVNQPDSVTQQGDALSAGNLNDLEDRIANAFDDVETSKADKTETEDLQNQITNLDSRIDSNTQRIENLEYKSSPFTINYPDTTYGEGTVPSSIAKSGKALRTKGKNGVTNQLQYNGNFASSDGWSGGTVSSGYIEASANASTYSRVYTTSNNPAIIQGHVYFASAKMKAISGLTSGNTSYNLRINGTGSSSNAIGFSSTGIPNGTTVMLSGVFTASADHAGTNPPKYWGCYNDTNAHTVQWSDCIIRDLTSIFPDLTSAQIVALGVGGVLKQRPDLALYDDYNVGTLIKPMVTGLESVGVNLWDEQWEVGEYDGSGNKISGNGIRSAGFIELLPSVSYYLKNSATMWLCFYDENKTFIRRTSTSGNSTIGQNINERYLTFNTASVYGNVYKNDIQIADNSLPSSVKTTYHPHFHSEITLSEPVELNGVGTAEDVIEVESGAITRQMGSYTFTGEETWTSYSGTSKRTDITGLGAKNIGANDIPNLTNDMGLVTTSRNAIQSAGGITVSATTIIISNDSVALAVAGRHICFELATPTSDTIAPSPTALAVEPYGTIKVKQSTTPLSLGFSMEYIPSSPYLTKSDVVDNLTSTETQLPLSANMGRYLNTLLGIERKRIDNLEQTSGQTEIEVSYPDDVLYAPNIVPAKSAKWAGIKTLRGKTRAWNQLVDPSALQSASSDVVSAVYNNDGSFTVTISSTTTDTVYLAIMSAYIAVPQGHLCFIGDSNGLPTGVTYRNSAYAQDVGVNSVFTSNASAGVLLVVKISSGVTAQTFTIKPFLRDLTLIFPDNTPTTVADALQRCADLAKWDDYGYSLVTETVSAVKSVGVNIFDEVMELGSIDNSGQNTASTTLLRSTNYQPVKGDTKYFFNTRKVAAHEYDINKNWLGEASGGENDGDGFNWTTRPNCAYLRFRTTANYGTTYLHDIQICLNSYADKTTYHAHEEHTLTLPQPFSGKSAGSVAEVYDLETGKVTHPIGSYTFTGNETWTTTGTTASGVYRMVCDAVSSIIKTVGSSDVPNILSADYLPKTLLDTYDSDTGISVNSAGSLVIYDPNYNTSSSTSAFATYMTGKTIYFELTTPSLTTVTPMDDPSIKVQGYGTIETVQTQSPVIDNCLDVTYDIIP